MEQRGGGFGRARGRGRGRGRSEISGSRGRGTTQKPSSRTPAKVPATPEKYVVIINNVENDFARVHEASLPSFLGLNACQARHHPARAAASCVYDVTCRTETRSAEVQVSGPADAPVSSIFVSRRKPGNPVSRKDISQPEAEHPNALNVTECTTDAQNSVNGAFTSLEEMAAVLSHRAYFTHPPQFHVSIPGKETGDRLTASNAAASSGRSHKRARDGENTNSTAPLQNANEGNAPAMLNHSDVAEEEEHGKCTEDGGPIVQFGGKQSELVTAVAAVSARWNTKELRHHLQDLPGFLSCWVLYAKHFRVVFRDRTFLFQAKQLLDQFQVDGSVQVSVSLADTLNRQYAEFIAAAEAMD